MGRSKMGFESGEQPNVVKINSAATNSTVWNAPKFHGTGSSFTAPSTMFVIDTDQRRQKMYQLLQKRYFDHVEVVKDLDALLLLHPIDESIRFVALNIDTTTQSDLRFIEPLVQKFPLATIFVTAPLEIMAYIKDVTSISERIELVAKPFQVSKLIDCVKQNQ